MVAPSTTAGGSATAPVTGVITRSRGTPPGYDGAVKRLFSGIAVTVLVVAGVAAAIIVLSSRDGGSLDQGSAASSPAGPTPAPGEPAATACTRDGNVVVKFSAPADGIQIDQLAEQLGAINTAPARAGGQAIIAKEKAGLDGVTALTSCQEQADFPSATDPGLEAFVRQYLGNKEPANS